jgi:hypothetical protein
VGHDTFCSYIEVPLKQGLTRLSKSHTAALVFYVLEKNGTLWLYIDFYGFNQIMKKKLIPTAAEQ